MKRKMSENWKEPVAETAGKALSLRFLFELTGVNLRKMGRDHNAGKRAWGRPVVGQEWGRRPSGLQAKQSHEGCLHECSGDWCWPQAGRRTGQAL